MPNGHEVPPEQPPRNTEAARVWEERIYPVLRGQARQRLGENATQEQIEEYAGNAFLALIEGSAGAQERLREKEYSVREPQIRPLPKGELGNQLKGGLSLDAVPEQTKKTIDVILEREGLKDFDTAKIKELLRKPWSDDHGTLFGALEELKTAIETGRQSVKDTDNLNALKQLDSLLKNVEEWQLQLTTGIGREELGGVSFSLSGTEIDGITKDLAGARKVFEAWVSGIESVNKFSHEDVNQGFYSRFWTAVPWFRNLQYPKEGTLEEVTQKKNDLINEFRTRLENHNMKVAMSKNDEQTIIGQAGQMGSATIFEGLRISKSQIAFNLYQRIFERYRLRLGDPTEIWNIKEHKLVKLFKDEDGLYKAFDQKKQDYVVIANTPEAKAAYQIPGTTGVALDRITMTHLELIQNEVKEELTSNYHLYGFDSEQEALTAAKLGFNVFRASMRMAVHVSRGRVSKAKMESKLGYRELRKDATYETDPDEVLVNQYNPWQFMIEKWNRMGKPQYAIFKKIMELYGEKDLDVGHQKMINALNIADYFSSSWRIQTIFEGLENRLVVSENGDSTRAKARMDTLATGLKMQWKKEKEKEEAAKQVARFRPLEFAKAYAVTVDEYGREHSVDHKEFKQQAKFQDKLKKGEFDVGKIEIRDYVKLEEILGRYIYPIYEKAMNPTTATGEFDWTKLKGIDIAADPNKDSTDEIQKFHNEIIEKVVKLVNERKDIPDDQKIKNPDQLKELYKKVQDFVLEDDTITDILENPKHDNLHHKTLYLDDAPLGAMEKPGGDNIPKISKQFHEIEGGRRDPYARMWGDTFTATTAQTHMWAAINARNPDTLVEELNGVATALTSYADRPSYMNLSMNITAGWLHFAKADALWNLVGLANKVPWATSEFERMFSLAAPSMSPLEIQGVYEKVKLNLGDLSKEDTKGLDARIKKELGIGIFKVFLSTSKMVAFVALVAMMQAIMKELETIDE